MTDEEKQEVPKPAPKPAKDQGYVQSWADHPIGYPRLSERMGAHNESMIFRKFSALNSRVLLYLQADLVQLENQLHAIERRDNKDNHGWRSKYATDFHWLQKSREDGCDHQLALIREIQGKLQTYSTLPSPFHTPRSNTTADKMLLQTAQMNRIADPDRFDLTNMQNYLFSDEMGAGAMVGSDSLTWGQPSDRAAHAPDLLGLCARTTSDSFSRIVAENTVCFFRFGLGRLAPKDRHIGHEGYHDATVLRATLWITSFVASLLPILSIIVLIHLETLKAKLWTIAGFNVLISFCLNMFTEASRKDAFAVTAA
jgi:hypothetical protein